MKAAILSDNGEIVAILVEDTGIHAGTVEYAWETAGGRVLVNARRGKLTRARRALESRQALECMASARCVDDTVYPPRFLIIEDDHEYTTR